MKSKGELKILYISRILPHKNISYVIDILSNLPKKNIELSIYGVIEDQKYWANCLKKLKGIDLKFNYKGYANNNELNKIFSNHHLFFFPTLGENFGHIISESLQNSCPVLISDRTPWKKLSYFKCGWDISLDNKNEFIERIIEMYNMDNKEFNSMKKGCLKAFEKNYNLKEIISDYNNLF
jgi:glycosyltransferase involved in cell wall biosynthesis